MLCGEGPPAEQHLGQTLNPRADSQWLWPINTVFTGGFLYKRISVLLLINIINISQPKYKWPATCSHKTTELDGHVGAGPASVESPARAEGWERWAVVVYQCLIMMAPVVVVCSDSTVPPHCYSLSTRSPNESPCRRSLSRGAHGIPPRQRLPGDRGSGRN